jgi:hypothetical protein
MTTFQTAPHDIDFSKPYRGARPFPQAYPGKGTRLKGAKNIPGVLQSYVTYDTLRRHMNLPTALF